MTKDDVIKNIACATLTEFLPISLIYGLRANYDIDIILAPLKDHLTNLATELDQANEKDYPYIQDKYITIIQKCLNKEEN